MSMGPGRYELVQAADAQRFGVDTEQRGGPAAAGARGGAAGGAHAAAGAPRQPPTGGERSPTGNLSVLIIAGWTRLLSEA